MEQVEIDFLPEHIHLFDPRTERNLAAADGTLQNA